MADSGVVGRIARRVMRAGIVIGPEVIHDLAAYVELLFRWNRRMNLTALAWDDRGLDRLIIEPLAAAQRLPAGAMSIIDIGSGSGSPAVPMKLAVPRVGLRMVESKTRKGAFLQEVVRQLGLSDTEILTCRYEDLPTRSGLREAADVVTVRAVRVDDRSLKCLQQLVRGGGSVFLFKGASEQFQPKAVRPPLRYYGTYSLLDSLQSRLVVLVKKSE